MKIINIIHQHRRDFRAEYKCEGCGYTYVASGYDDRNFHDDVIPKIKCPKCGETSESLGVDYRPLTTKYPEGYQV